MLKPGDKIRIKRVIGGINSEDWKLMAEVQTIDTVSPTPLDEDEDHLSIWVVGFPYMISSHDVAKDNQPC